MNREQRIDESLRLMVTALAYIIAGIVCAVISLVHMINENWGWAAIMWLIAVALRALSGVVKRESVRTYPDRGANGE